MTFHDFIKANLWQLVCLLLCGTILLIALGAGQDRLSYAKAYCDAIHPNTTLVFP